MSKLQKIMFIIIAFIFTFKQSLVNAINFGADENVVSTEIIGDTASADVAAQTILNRALGFLGLLAVFFAMYGGFLILTAGEQEEKAKKGKKILVLAGLGLVVIFLSYSVVIFVTNSLLGGSGAESAQ